RPGAGTLRLERHDQRADEVEAAPCGALRAAGNVDVPLPHPRARRARHDGRSPRDAAVKPVSMLTPSQGRPNKSDELFRRFAFGLGTVGSVPPCRTTTTPHSFSRGSHMSVTRTGGSNEVGGSGGISIRPLYGVFIGDQVEQYRNMLSATLTDLKAGIK